MEMALAAHSVPMFLHPLAYGVGNLEVPYSTWTLARQVSNRKIFFFVTRLRFLSDIRSIDFTFFWCSVLKCNDVTLVSLNQGSIVFFVLFSFRHYTVAIPVPLGHTHKYELVRLVLKVPAQIMQFIVQP